MEITLERTRLIFSEYNDLEKRKIDNLVGTMDKVFSYEDIDKHIICLPTGMMEAVKKAFPEIRIKDDSSTYWDYAFINPIEHDAQPRNQLQIDFIQFMLDCAENKEKLAGILSPGTGKGIPLHVKIPTPYGFKRMGEIEVGDQVFGSNGNPVIVKGVYDQGIRDVYKITFNDGRTALCDDQHLWSVQSFNNKSYYTMQTIDLIEDYKVTNPDNGCMTYKYNIPVMSSPVKYEHQNVSVDPYEYGKTFDISKPIPEDYMYNDINVRWKFLLGLFDSGKCVTYKNPKYYVICFIQCNQCNQSLLKQIEFILRSIGFVTTIDNDLKEISFPIVYGIHQGLISVDDNIKLDIEYPKCLYIKDIQKIGREPTRCLKVSAKNQLFLTEDFIVTHNTFMACYAAIKVGARTLIITPTTNIKNQWGETLTNMFNVDKDKVVVVNNPKQFINVKGDFVVISQASLSVLNKTYDLQRILKNNKFGIKIIDEVQMWFHNIIKVDGCSNICHNWYLTGTFGRSGEEENDLYQRMFGDLKIFREKDKNPTLFNRKPGNVYGMKPHMNVKMMWAHSGLSKEEITKVSSSMRYSERSGKWVRYGISIPNYTNLVIPADGTMTKFLSNIIKVIKMANNEVTYGRMLVLSPTIASVNVIEDKLKSIYPNLKIGTINSYNNKQENDRVKAECDIMISTVKSCGTGFDVKDLSKLIVAEQYKSGILTEQVSGRLRRRPDGKDTYMWDIVDADVPQLKAWAHSRAEILKKKSKVFKVIDL